MDAQGEAELAQYVQEYRATTEETRWAILRGMLNGLDRRIEEVGAKAEDAHKAAVLAGDIAKGAIEAAEARLGARLDTLTDEAKTIARGVNEIRTNIGGVLELAESALTMAGSAQRALSKVAGNYEESARNSADSTGSSRPSSPG